MISDEVRRLADQIVDASDRYEVQIPPDLSAAFDAAAKAGDIGLVRWRAEQILDVMKTAASARQDGPGSIFRAEGVSTCGEDQNAAHKGNQRVNPRSSGRSSGLSEGSTGACAANGTAQRAALPGTQTSTGAISGTISSSKSSDLEDGQPQSRSTATPSGGDQVQRSLW